MRAVLAELPHRSDREPVLRTGMGGDDTTAIDARRRGCRHRPAGRLRPRVHARLGGARPPGRRHRHLGRARPDRRLDQRQARVAVLLALHRDRGGRDDGRRRLRLRLRLRHLGGVDGRARRRRAPERRAARAGAAEGVDRAARARGDANRPGGPARAGARRPRAPAADLRLAGDLALPPRRRPRGRGLLAEAGPLGGHRGGAAARPGAGLGDRPARRAAVRHGAARPRGSVTSRRRRARAWRSSVEGSGSPLAWSRRSPRSRSSS